MQTNPSRREEELTPRVFEYPVLDTVSLTREFTLPNADVFDVINRRRSFRSFKQLAFDELSSILWFSAKVKSISVEANGYVLSHRPSASAGARHPIDILVVSKLLDGLLSVCYYNPFEHSLSRLKTDAGRVDEFINHLNFILNVDEGAILWLVAHPDRTGSKYYNSESLIWKDAGALIHSIQIACSALNFNSCPLGTLGEPFVSNLFEGSDNIFSAGGIVVGK